MNWQWIATNWPKIADLALTHVQIALPPIAVAFLVAGTAGPHDVARVSFGLFLLGLGWSAVLVSGSAPAGERRPPG